MPSWTSQFEQPTMESLVGQIDPELSGHFDALRHRVAEILDCRPTLEWMGITWHWCELYAPDDGGLLIDLRLVPDPKLPRVAMTLSRGFFERQPPEKLHRCLQGGLRTASCIGQRVWCEWIVSSSEVADQLCAVIEKARADSAATS